MNEASKGPVFPTVEASGTTGIATTSTLPGQKGKGTDNLSLAYGDTNNQQRFSRKLLQELPSTV